MKRVIFIAMLSAGCGSNWSQDPDQVFTQCLEGLFYLDEDGDGWGDMASEATQMCEEDIEFPITAKNRMDCNDGDAQITGQVGAICPEDLVRMDDLDSTIQVAGMIYGNREYAVVYGAETPARRYTFATQVCEAWGGYGYEDNGTDPVPEGHLVTLGSVDEKKEVLNFVKDLVEAEQGLAIYAGFLGVYWKPNSTDDLLGDGTWDWVDTSSTKIINSEFNWCGGKEIHPSDFFPTLNSDDPDHVPAIEQEVEHIRLALVLAQDEWCLGVPTDAYVGGVGLGEEDTASPDGDATVADYDDRFGHFICERAAPSLGEHIDSI